MTMMSRFEIITTSIRPSTSSIVSVSRVIALAKAGSAPGTETLARITSSAASLPIAASTRCTSSTQNCQTYTHCATMSPR